ncbi:MAG: hypothetical protein AB7N71_10835 [Phycisphaerae bacterium]
MAIAILGGLFIGCVYLPQTMHVYAVRNCEIVTGTIISRKETRGFSIPHTDFEIQILDTDIVVHARTGLYPELQESGTVRFRYSGDSQREVFLMDYEESPFGVLILSWGCAIALGGFLIYEIRKERRERAEMMELN